MPKLNQRPGVSRQVRYSQPGFQGQPQTTILNQAALARRREAAARVQSDLLRGVFFFPNRHLESHFYCI